MPTFTHTLRAAAFVLLQLCALLLVLWICDYTALPGTIPGTSMQPYSLGMLVVMVLVLVAYQKILLWQRKSLSIQGLAVRGFLVVFAAQLIYQALRQLWVLRHENNEKLWDYTVSMTALFFLSWALSFSVALELRKAHPLYKYGCIALCFVLVILLKHYATAITW